MRVSVRFAIAKYIPDLFRMEPRNFGVIAWASNGAVSSKFVEASSQSSRSRIIEKDAKYAYAQWLDYWKYYLDADSIRSTKFGTVARKNPNYFEALLEKSKDRFQLVEAGGLLDKIPEKQLEQATQDLYSRVVETPSQILPMAEHEDLRKATKALLNRVRLPQIHRGTIPIIGHVMGAQRKFNVDYVLGDAEAPKAIMQQVLLSRSQSINSNALMFQALTTDNQSTMKKKQCAALINTNHPLDDNSKEGMEILDRMAVLIDVSKDNAENEILRFAQENEAA